MRVVDSLQDDEFSAVSVLGGWRGITESVAPIIVFVTAYVLTRHVQWPLIAAGALAGVFVVARLIAGQQITQALSGVFGVAISCIFVLFSGRGEDFFVFGIVTSALAAIVLLATCVIRRPAVALVLSVVWNREELRHAPPAGSDAVLHRRCMRLTWVWFALFAIRVAVQLPLWWTGHIAALGVAKLVLGLPLFAIVCWITWMILRPFSSLSSTTDGQGQ